MSTLVFFILLSTLLSVSTVTLLHCHCFNAPFSHFIMFTSKTNIS